jgi:hypothetical protein
MEFASGLRGAFTFLPQERVIFGKGSLAQVATEIDRLGCQRAFVITGFRRPPALSVGGLDVDHPHGQIRTAPGAS